MESDGFREEWGRGGDLNSKKGLFPIHHLQKAATPSKRSHNISYIKWVLELVARRGRQFWMNRRVLNEIDLKRQKKYYSFWGEPELKERDTLSWSGLRGMGLAS